MCYCDSVRVTNPVGLWSIPWALEARGFQPCCIGYCDEGYYASDYDWQDVFDNIADAVDAIYSNFDCDFDGPNEEVKELCQMVQEQLNELKEKYYED